jgi:transposase
MHPGRLPSPLTLTPVERETLERWASGRDPRLARRAAIVLGLGAGEAPKALARRFRLSEPTVGKWRTRFEASRLGGLVDATRPGAPRRILAEDIERVLIHLRQPPPAGAPRWTTRSLAHACGVSQTTVSRIWRARGVDPRSGTVPALAPPSGNGGSPPPSSAPSVTASSEECRANELARLAREVTELKALAPPEEGPFLRVALEAIEAALLSATLPRLHGAREGSRPARMRIATAVAQARSLVQQARSRLAEPHAGGEARFRRGDRGGAGKAV